MNREPPNGLVDDRADPDTRIGWLKRVGGDEWLLLAGARTILRSSGMRRLDELASDGPTRDHQLSDASKGPEEVHRLLIRRSLPADEKIWAKEMPRPEGWANEQ